jgi:hypothetical protein
MLPRMYYDSFAPRTRPAAMPSPRSRIVPYFSGRVGTFDNFLEEFEARAYDCRLTDLQQVDALVCYVNPSFCKTCKSLNGYQSCEWSLFRHSLVNVFGTTIPHHQITKQKLHNLVEDSCRMQMDRKEDMLQYYRTFKHYSDPLIRSGHLTEMNCDIEFWYGFHPHNRDILWQRLLAVYPFHQHDIPFHFEDVFDCACRVFAYEERLLFWPGDQEFKHPRISRRYPSHSYTPDPQFPSFSCLFSESQYAPAPSVMKVQPKPEPKPELMPSITPTSPSTPSLTSLCTNGVPKSELETLSNTLTSSPLLQLSSSMCSFTDIVPESESKTMPSIILPTLPSLPLVPSLQSSCTDVVPEPESISELASLHLSPSMSSEPSLPLLSSSCHVDIPEPECTPPDLPMSPTLSPSCTDPVAEPKVMSLPIPLSPSSILSTAFECPLSPTCVPVEVQLPKLASLLTSTSSNTVDHSKITSVPKPEFTLMSPLSDPSTRLPANRVPSPSTIDTPPAVYPSSKLLPAPLCFMPLSWELACKPESTPTSTFDIVPLCLSISTLKSLGESISLPAPFLEVLNAPVSPSSTLQEKMLEVTPSEVVSMRLPLAASPTLSLEVSNAPVSPNSTSQEQTLGVTLYGVTPEVTSTTLLPANASARLVPLPSYHLPAFFHSFSTVDILNLTFDPPLLPPSESVPILPMPPLNTSLNVPSSLHLSPSQPPLGLMQDNSAPCSPPSPSTK